MMQIMSIARKSERRGTVSFSLPSFFPSPFAVFPLLSLNIAQGLGECCNLPSRSGQSPASKCFCAIFSPNLCILQARTDAIFIFSSSIPISYKFYTAHAGSTATSPLMLHRYMWVGIFPAVGLVTQVCVFKGNFTSNPFVGSAISCDDFCCL